MNLWKLLCFSSGASVLYFIMVYFGNVEATNEVINSTVRYTIIQITNRLDYRISGIV